MANNLSRTTQKDLLDLVMFTAGSTNWAAPGSIWVGLCSAAPDDTTTNEITGATNYARKQITFGASSSASPSVTTGPTAVCTFTSAGGNWSTLSGYVLCAASTGSTGTSRYLAYGAISPTVAVTTNDVVEFAAAAISLSFD
jgi:hypothetical protein